MAKQKKKSSTSLYSFIEQTAQMLRRAAKPFQKKDKSNSPGHDLSNKNKIERIAALLRSKAKKRKKRKKTDR